MLKRYVLKCNWHKYTFCKKRKISVIFRSGSGNPEIFADSERACQDGQFDILFVKREKIRFFIPFFLFSGSTGSGKKCAPRVVISGLCLTSEAQQTGSGKLQRLDTPGEMTNLIGIKKPIMLQSIWMQAQRVLDQSKYYFLSFSGNLCLIAL